MPASPQQPQDPPAPTPPIERIQALENMLELQERRLLSAEQLARDRGLCLQTVMDVAPGIVLLLDSDLRITRFNSAAERLSERLGAELIGTPLALLFSVTGTDLRAAAAAKHAIDAQLATASGDSVPVSLHVRAIEVDSGECGLVVVALDQRDRLERQLQLAQDKKLRSIGALAAGIAHEINTPIQFVGDSVGFLDDSVRGLSEALNAYRQAIRDAGEQPLAPEIVRALVELESELDIEFIQEEISGACARAREGVQRVTAIVDAMRQFAHPGAQAPRAIDLNRLVETTLLVARNEYKYVAEVETDLGDLPPVVCIKNGLDQVILNLVVNAAQAVAEKVPAEYERGLISITTFCDGNDACIRIADNGPGLDPAILERVFDPFFTTKPEGVGTGQGLTICRQIVEADHGGKLEAESTPGSGACFTIRIPLDQEAQASAETES